MPNIPVLQEMRISVRGATLLLAVSVALHCNGFETAKSPAEPITKMTALDHARDLLAHRSAGSVISNIGLAGFSFEREMEIGSGLHVITISCNLGGGLAVFGADGTLLTTRPTNEITSVQLFDIDEDGVAEVVTEEIDARGTGVLEKTFRMYQIANSSVHEFYARHASDDRHVQERVGFIRFDGSAAGRNARLTHLLIDASHREKESNFEWTGETRRGPLTVVVAERAHSIMTFAQCRVLLWVAI